MRNTLQGPSRRQMIGGAAAMGVAVLLPAGRASAAQGGNGVTERLRALEQQHGARLGVYAHAADSGRTVRHRADELFPLCSTFKTLAVAAVLRDLDGPLDRVIHYTAQEASDSGHAPVTGDPKNVASGLTIEQLCDATIRFSDNCAANLLLRELGGPEAVTRLCRSLGDRVTRLDRWEPALNSAEPGRVTDTTSPRALARTNAKLVTGRALDRADRERLTAWLLGNTTGDERLRAGLPKDWRVAEKTGTGAYGTANDAGVAWPPGRGPVAITVLTTHQDPKATADAPLIAAAAAIVAEALA
ncbi:class A beta-lactamase [Kitasatospora sp. NPDC051853]|uniref:class A beta-lactamase n=1 Tax=Kitasatospora sp. NPDC051853 TaxID=3364058 RepID=UPI003787EE07